MKIKNKKSFYLACGFSVLLLVSMIYNIYSRNKEYIIQEQNQNQSSSTLFENIENTSAIKGEEILKENVKVNSENEPEFSKTVTVFVSGAVKEPKVVTLENGKRLVDAVALCGGLSKEADLNRINLSLKLKEEQHYVIPKSGEPLTENTVENQMVGLVSSSETSKININKAGLEELKSLPGVGDVLAKRILEKRQEIGNFKSPEDLLNVPGIGEKKYNDIKDKIIIN